MWSLFVGELVLEVKQEADLSKYPFPSSIWFKDMCSMHRGIEDNETLKIIPTAILWKKMSTQYVEISDKTPAAAPVIALCSL